MEERDIETILTEIRAVITEQYKHPWNHCADCGAKKPTRPTGFRQRLSQSDKWIWEIDSWQDEKGCTGWSTVSVSGRSYALCAACSERRDLSKLALKQS